MTALPSGTVQDVKTANLQALGLKQTSQNFAELAGPIKDRVGRSASLRGMLVVNRAVKAATYSTFSRVSGFIRSGFSVRVSRQLTPDGELLSFLVQHPQDITGHSEAATAFRKAYVTRLSGKRSVSIEPQKAFWWRFLEFGTGPRFSKKKPKFLKRGTGPAGPREWRSLRAYQGAGARGAITSRSWIRPARAASEHQAVDAFTKWFREDTESEVARLPKR